VIFRKRRSAFAAPLAPDFPGLLCAAHSATFSPAQSLTESILKFALCCRQWWDCSLLPRHVLAHGKQHNERAVGECLNYFFVYSCSTGASNFFKRSTVAAFSFSKN